MSSEDSTIWITFFQFSEKKSYFLEVSPNDLLSDVISLLAQIYHLDPNLKLRPLSGPDVEETKTIKDNEINNFDEFSIIISSAFSTEIERTETSDSDKQNEDENANDPPNMKELVETLCSLGYSEPNVYAALRENHYDPNIANYLLENGFSKEKKEVIKSSSPIEKGVLFSERQTSKGLRVSSQEYHDAMRQQYNALSDQEKASIQNLVKAGFSQSQAVEAYIVCQKNEANALAFLKST